MNAASALAHLRGLGKRVVTTNDVTLALGLEGSAATQTLKRLAAAGLLRRIRHGLWAVDAALDPLVLPEYLTAPFPSYVSFQSALFLRGMVSQVPEVIYVASLAQTRKVGTSLGTFSIHRLAPTFFGGYDTLPESAVRLATPEKALLDMLYLGPSRSTSSRDRDSRGLRQTQSAGVGRSDSGWSSTRVRSTEAGPPSEAASKAGGTCPTPPASSGTLKRAPDNRVNRYLSGRSSSRRTYAPSGPSKDTRRRASPLGAAETVMPGTAWGRRGLRTPMA